MRKVKVTYYEINPSDFPEEKKDIIAMFHCWGNDADGQTMALVELKNGVIVEVCPTNLVFIDWE